MKRIAIVGGGIAGLSAAYAIAQRIKSGAPMELMLFEASSRLGGIVETVRREGFVMECGPDSWVTEKPWARELAVELGLGDQIISSNDMWRRTYLAPEAGARSRALIALPDGMRMMVPTDWAAMLHSPLLSWQAKLAYLREPKRAKELKAAALANCEADLSVRDFICGHFGAEVAETLAAPLLAGVFGGDIASLSARAVIPAFVELEREHGSLILGLQEKVRAKKTASAVFTTLRDGLGVLIERMEEQIPAESIRRNTTVTALEREGAKWRVRTSGTSAHSRDEMLDTEETFDELVLATPAHVTGPLLAKLDERIPALLPQEASSAIVVALAFAPEQARGMRVPRGFGFLVPQRKTATRGEDSGEAMAERALLACTFVDQKFSHRVPEGGVLLRAFFGGAEAPALLGESDAALARLAAESVGRILGKLPKPKFSVVRRWPRSLPQYAVGHLERMAELEQRVALMPGLRLLGNAYYGVGLPDLIGLARPGDWPFRQLPPFAKSKNAKDGAPGFS